MNYDDWNRAIADKFYNRDKIQRPVYLYVDEECLKEIAIQNGLNPESAHEVFVQAILKRGYCIQQNRSQPFFKILRWRIWEGQLQNDPTEPPPFIAFLGFCVLAATDMTGDTSLKVVSSNYYVRLNKLLGLSGRGQPTGFDEIERAWERLNCWLQDDLNGEFGLPTANNALYGRHVGYPISQALMRRTDFEELPDFFQWCGLEPGEENVEASYIKQQLQLWANGTTCSFSRQLELVFEQDQQQHVQAIAEMTLAYYQTWDGSKQTHKDGLRTAEIFIQLTRSGRSFELSLHPRAPHGFPEGQYGSETLSRVDDTKWFEPLGEGSVTEWLKGNKIELRQDHYCLNLQVKTIFPLRSDLTSDLGGWLTCSRVRLGEKHFVLCHQSMQQQIESYLARYGEEGWRVMHSRDPIYADWVCITNVRITKFTPTEQGELDCLVPAKQIGIHLSGGLSLKRGVWLKGGEPEAMISTDVQLPVLLDGVEIKIATPDSTIIHLQEYDLAEGIHTVKVGERERKFAISNSGNDLLGTSRMSQWGYLFRRISDAEFKPLSLTATVVPSADAIPSGQLYVTGTQILHSIADPPPPRQHLLILPYGARKYIVLGHNIGEIFEPNLPTLLPEWKAESYLQGYKQQVPFEPQWLITISHRNNMTLRPLGQPKQAVSETISNEDKEAWLHWAGKRRLSRRLSSKHRHLADLWAQYGEIAR